MMLLLTIAAMASADLDRLDTAVDRCERDIANPIFTSDMERRSQFATAAYREQEEIVAARLDLANRRRAAREAVPAVKVDEAEFAKLGAAIEDRQRALNDQRLLESLRVDAMDVKRRYYLSRCASGKESGGGDSNARR